MSGLSLEQWMALLRHFLLLSLLSVGGAIVVAPDMHRVMVGQMGLINDAQFNASIAIGQAAPGPNVLFVAVLGYQAAGLAGALLVLGALLLPSTTLAIAASRWSQARRQWRGVQAIKAGLAPLSIALMFATGWILSAEAPSVAAIAITVSSALLVWRTRLHLLWLIATGAALGAFGLV